jgi:flagellar motor component MotA
MSLEDEVDQVADPFMKRGFMLAVDGTNPSTLRAMLDAESGSLEDAEESPAKVYEAAGGYAPTVGILGAVLGLIHVMENLSDPNKLGAGIAVAFVATVYGVGSANLLFLPIASKLRTKALQKAAHANSSWRASWRSRRDRTPPDRPEAAGLLSGDESVAKAAGKSARGVAGTSCVDAGSRFT